MSGDCNECGSYPPPDGTCPGPLDRCRSSRRRSPPVDEYVKMVIPDLVQLHQEYERRGVIRGFQVRRERGQIIVDLDVTPTAISEIQVEIKEYLP